MYHTTHSYECHDPSTCVNKLRLIHMDDTTHSHMSWPIYMCEHVTTHSYMWHDSFTHVMTHSYVWTCHDPFIYVTRLINTLSICPQTGWKDSWYNRNSSAKAVFTEMSSSRAFSRSVSIAISRSVKAQLESRSQLTSSNDSRSIHLRVVSRNVQSSHVTYPSVLSWHRWWDVTLVMTQVMGRDSYDMCTTESCHLPLSHVTYAWVMSHIYESCHMCMRPVTYAWVMSRITESCHVRLSHVTYQWVLSHIPQSYHMQLRRVAYASVMSHIYQRVKLRVAESGHKSPESCHVRLSRVTYYYVTQRLEAHALVTW